MSNSKRFLPYIIAPILIIIGANFIYPNIAWAANSLPAAGTVSPNKGILPTNQPIEFTTTYTDPDGWRDIKYMYILINTELMNKNCCYAYYDSVKNKFFLRNDDNTAWLDDANIIENSYVKLDRTLSSVSSVYLTRTVKWNIIFKDAFKSVQVKKIYLYAADSSGATSGWASKGTCLLGENFPPQVGAIKPNSGASQPGEWASLRTSCSDPNGWQDIRYAYIVINTTLSNKKSFYAYYDSNVNKLFLRNDDDTAWLGGFTLGSANIIENSSVRLDCSQTNIEHSGVNFLVNWRFAFKDAFAGSEPKKVYVYSEDFSGGKSGWLRKGTWTVTQTLSISVNPKEWQIAATSVNGVVTMAGKDKITISNDGNGAEAFELKLVNPVGWTAGTVPGQEVYVLSGIFCSNSDLPIAADFRIDDVIVTTAKTASDMVFAYDSATANGAAVPSGGSRALFLQFKSPSITAKQNEQNVSVIITCRAA